MKERTVLRPKKKHAASGQKLMLAFAALAGAALLSPASRFLIYAFPVGALLLSIYLVRKNKAAYVGFVCWLYILTPFVRRVVDYKAGSPETTLMLTPFLAGLACLIVLLPRWAEALNGRSSAMIYVLGAIFYGGITTLLQLHFADFLQGMTLWLAPLFFGIFIYLERQHVRELYSGFERAMVGGTLVAGGYGIAQYISPSSWDSVWMEVNHLISIGPAEPMNVRVFSTMNAPQVLGAFLVVGILMAIRSASKLKFAAIPLGVISLVLSMSRSAWVAMLAGITYLCFRLPSRERTKLIVVAAICAFLLMGLTQVPAMHEAFSTRFSSFTDVKHDESANDRAETYASVVQSLSRSPFGLGIGVEGQGNASVSDAEHDSTIVNMLLSLGVLGSSVFTFGLAALFVKIVFARKKSDDAGLTALQAAVIALMAEAALNNVLTGPVAFLTWSAIGLGYANVEARRDVFLPHRISGFHMTSQKGSIS
jgi:hypothetical protein